ncbi:MAG: endonuclease III [Candidatus Methanomethyliaceae archaeon]|nr:endonuclease III [Candidatus Methanomethyliaceae archaeon]
MDARTILKGMRSALGEESWTALGEMSRNDGPENPFKVLIGTILSHRTRDERTAEATDSLFKRFRSAKDLAGAKADEVMELIRGVGFYRVKSQRIIEVARIINERYGGRVPDTLEELLELPSVGRKTANCVLVYGFKKEAIPVDTHVHRIANRLGIVHTKKPEETELGLRKFFPKKDWLEVNDLFVSFGKTVCKPVGPRCIICPLKEGCSYYEKVVKIQKL